MKVTGERAVTSAGGFNPAWQRHVAAYVLCEPFLGPGRVLDVGCGTGHSYDQLAPRETVGVDIEPEALRHQDRETVVADMRELPFAESSFESIIASHAVEHVPDPHRSRQRSGTGPRAGRGRGLRHTEPPHLRAAQRDHRSVPLHRVRPRPAAGALRGLIRRGGGTRAGRVETSTWSSSGRNVRRSTGCCGWIRCACAGWSRDGDASICTTCCSAHHRPATDPRAEAITVGDFELSDRDLERALDLYAICRGPQG